MHMGNVQTNSAGSNTATITSGGGVTMNFYGSTHANAYNDAKTSLSGFLDKTEKGDRSRKNTSFLGKIMDKMSGLPRLMDPTVEELGYSDRLMQMIKGNTTITTQEAANALVAYGKYPEKNTTGEHIDMETYPGVAVERFYTIATNQWSNTQAVNHTWLYPLPRSIEDVGIFGQNLSYHYLFNCGFMVHVQLNASKFHSGCLLVCMIPENENLTNTVPTPFTIGEQMSHPFAQVNQLPIFPHQYINLRTNNSATIVFPYVNAYPSDFSGTHDFVTLGIFVVAPLQYASGAATVINMTISISPMEATFSGLRHSINAQGFPVLGVPGSNEFVSTLRNPGLPVYPEFETTHSFENPGLVENMLQVLQRPTMCNFADSQPYFKVSNTTFNDEPIVTFKITLLDNKFITTYLSLFSRLYCSYRGSLILDFMFAGTALTTGKLIICYTPAGVEAPTKRKDAMQGTSMVWDIGLQSTAKFVVPYISTTQYRYINDADTVLGQDGYVTVFYQTAIVYPPGTPSNSYVVVTASAGEDFRLRMPFTSNLYQGDEGVPALEALEVGVQDPAISGTIQLTQNLPEFSIKEMDVEYLFSRYFCVSDEVVTGGFENFTIELNLHADKVKPIVATMFSLFTYFHFDLDINVKVIGTIIDYMVVYNPPYTTPPDEYKDTLWSTGLTPSVFSSTFNPPVSFRVPFPSSASYLTSFYDGRTTFQTSGNIGYGENPGNHLGTISVKLFPQDPNSTKTPTARVMIFIRPVNVRMCCPRPVMSFKLQPTTEVREVHGYPNYMYMGYVLQNPFVNFEDKHLGKMSRFLYKSVFPLDTQNGPTSCVFIEQNLFIIPAHLYTPDMTIWTGPEKKQKLQVLELKLVEENDLAFVRVHMNAEPMDVGQLREGKVTIVYCSKLMGYHTQTARYPKKVSSINTGKIVKNIIEVPFPSQFGYCGGILVQKGRVLGIQVAGNATWSSFSAFVKHTGSEPEVREQHGLRDYAVSIGDGIGEGLKNQLEDIISNTKNTVKGNIEQQLIEKILRLFVKSISSLAIVANSKNPAVSISALGAIFCVDGISVEPLVYLKHKVCDLLGMQRDPVQQGPIDWMKDFNVACTTAKGIDWIWQYISTFIEWLKKKIEVEQPKRKRFNELLSEWPSMMVDMDDIALNQGKYTDTSITTLCKRVVEFKNLCDHFGVERSFSMSQVVRYYVLAVKWLSNMGKSRIEPVAVLIHGGPGQGKSIATELIGKAISKKLGGQMPYSLPPDPKHFDGYKQQDVVIMDDVCQNPDGEDVKLLCQMVSTTQFIPPMAALEEKGLPFTSRFFLASTNQQKLRPPTVSEPRALERRFFMDLTIRVKPNYCRVDGTLDFPAAVVKCNHDSCNFSACMPLVCGEAIELIDGRGHVYNIDQIVTLMLDEELKRSKCLNSLEILFQGPLQQRRSKGLVSSEIIDCIKSIKDQRIIEYFRGQGYIVPLDCECVVHRQQVYDYLGLSIKILSAITVVATLSTTIYLIYKLIVGMKQGPYEGGVKQKLIKPVPREKVVTQGPNEFNNKMMSDSLYDFSTQKGHYTAIGLFENFFLVPQHSKPGEEVNLRGVPVKVIRAVDLYVKNGNTELMVVQLDVKEKTRDIRKFLPKEIENHKNCWLLVDNANFPRMQFPVGMATLYGTVMLSGEFRQNLMQYPYPTRSGQCGGAIISGTKIIGMHVGGDGMNGYCAALKSSYFDFLVEEQGQIVSVTKAAKSVNVNHKTTLRPSVFFGVFPGDKEPAVLSKYDKRCELDFEENLFSKYKGNVEFEIDADIKMVVGQYVEQIKPILPNDLTQRLTIKEVVEGIENLEPLDLNTSAGYPYNTMGIGKKDLIRGLERNTDELEKCIQKYGLFLPYSTYLKDELRAAEKVKQGKTRLIEASSVNDTVHTKMVFGKLFQTFHKHPGVVTGSAVGCDPDVHWSIFYQMLGVENIGEFDYKNYDASLSPTWFEALKLFLAKLGYSQEDLKIIDHMNNSKHIYKNVEYDVKGGMPSGCSGTSIFNSIINNIIVKTLVVKTYKHVDLDQLKILAYGDDLLYSYPYGLEPKLIAETGKTFGLEMTPADKGEHFKIKNIYEVTFLKRSFVPDWEYPFLIHPVFDKQHIFESIRWTRNATATQEHIYSLLHLLWHSGYDEYKEFVDQCRSIPIGRAFHYYDYDVLRYQWLMKF